MQINPISIKDRIATAKTMEKIVVLAIFLFPVFAMSIRHWLSGIYSLLGLLAIFIVFRARHEPYREEKILLALFLLLLISLFISATLNGWSDNSIRRLGNISKYILFFPFYLLIRQYLSIVNLLLFGIIIGGIVFGIHALYDILVSGMDRAWGIYGPIVFGDLAALYMSFCIILVIFRKKISVPVSLCVVSIVLSIATTLLSGTRNAWLAMLLSLLIIPLLCYRQFTHKKAVLSLITLILATLVIFSFTETISKRIKAAYSQFQIYMTKGAPHDSDLLSNSIGTRLEQWRTALVISKDAPFFGYGAGNAGKMITYRARKGEAHPQLDNPDTIKGIGGLHSTYFETLVNEGIIGLIIMFAFLLYPLYVFYHARTWNPLVSATGTMFIINYMIFGLTENPFVHDNFTSVYLFFLAVFFSETIRSKYQSDQYVSRNDLSP